MRRLVFLLVALLFLLGAVVGWSINQFETPIAVESMPFDDTYEPVLTTVSAALQQHTGIEWFYFFDMTTTVPAVNSGMAYKWADCRAYFLDVLVGASRVPVTIYLPCGAIATAVGCQLKYPLASPERGIA